MIDRVPASAPFTPPLTGASIIWTPFSARRSAMERVTEGDMVLMSMTTDPGAAPSITPSGPAMTCSTSGESETQVMTISLLLAASLGEEALEAPASARGFMRDAVRFQTVTSWPAFTRFMHMGVPISPSPTKPTLAMRKSPGSA